MAACAIILLAGYAKSVKATPVKISHSHLGAAATCQYDPILRASVPDCIKWTAKVRQAQATIAKIAQVGTAWTYTGNGWFCPGTTDAVPLMLAAAIERNYAAAAKITVQSGGTVFFRGARLVRVGVQYNKNTKDVDLINVSFQNGDAAETHCWTATVAFLGSPGHSNVSNIDPGD
jgi:hypothetical protein